MSVYILSNANQVLGVFSSPLEAQKYYSHIVTVSQQGTFTVSQQGTSTVSQQGTSTVNDVSQQGTSTVDDVSQQGTSTVSQQGTSTVDDVSQQGTSTGTIKLEGFILNKTPGIDMTLLLKKGVGVGNERQQTIIMEESDSKKDEYSYRIFDPTPFQDNIYECYNCGGEDCRDGCINDNCNFSDF